MPPPPPREQGGGPTGQPAITAMSAQQMQVETLRRVLAIWEKLKNIDVRLQRIEKYLDVAPSQFGKKVNVDGKAVDVLERRSQ
jgi:hypothetical protein